MEESAPVSARQLNPSRSALMSLKKIWCAVMLLFVIGSTGYLSAQAQEKQEKEIERQQMSLL
jgi:hypothetical protein